MAIIPATPTSLPENNDFRNCAVYTWSNITTADTCEAVEIPSFPDRTVEVSGTFGAAGSIAIKGSIIGTVYNTLKAPNGDALSFLASDTESVLTAVRYLKPDTPTGDGTTSITVSIFMRG
jgi:hypothetical protein